MGVFIGDLIGGCYREFIGGFVGKSILKPVESRKLGTGNDTSGKRFGPYRLAVGENGSGAASRARGALGLAFLVYRVLASPGSTGKSAILASSVNGQVEHNQRDLRWAEEKWAGSSGQEGVRAAWWAGRGTAPVLGLPLGWEKKSWESDFLVDPFCLV